jgi:hypothetical protein
MARYEVVVRWPLIDADGDARSPGDALRVTVGQRRRPVRGSSWHASVVTGFRAKVFINSQLKGSPEAPESITENSHQGPAALRECSWPASKVEEGVSIDRRCRSSGYLPNNRCPRLVIMVITSTYISATFPSSQQRRPLTCLVTAASSHSHPEIPIARDP